MKLDKLLLIAGLLLIAYAAFSRFYGEPCVALTKFKSSSLLILGNTALLLALLSRK